jgi:hypothetical protein
VLYQQRTHHYNIGDDDRGVGQVEAWQKVCNCISSDMLLIKKCRTLHVVFKAGKNWDGYFDDNNLVNQV